MRDALEQSTDASLLGMGDAALALSSWLSTSEGPELPFNWAGDSHFGVLLLPMTLSVGHVSIQASDVRIATVLYLNSTKHTYTGVQWLTKERKPKGR